MDYGTDGLKFKEKLPRYVVHMAHVCSSHDIILITGICTIERLEYIIKYMVMS